jgi:hypothetical protein
MELKDFKEYEDFLEMKIQKEKEKSDLSNIVLSQLQAIVPSQLKPHWFWNIVTISKIIQIFLKKM